MQHPSKAGSPALPNLRELHKEPGQKRDALLLSQVNERQIIALASTVDQTEAAVVTGADPVSDTASGTLQSTTDADHLTSCLGRQ